MNTYIFQKLKIFSFTFLVCVSWSHTTVENNYACIFIADMHFKNLNSDVIVYSDLFQALQTKLNNNIILAVDKYICKEFN